MTHLVFQAVLYTNKFMPNANWATIEKNSLSKVCKVCFLNLHTINARNMFIFFIIYLTYIWNWLQKTSYWPISTLRLLEYLGYRKWLLFENWHSARHFKFVEFEFSKLIFMSKIIFISLNMLFYSYY